MQTLDGQQSQKIPQRWTTMRGGSVAAAMLALLALAGCESSAESAAAADTAASGQDAVAGSDTAVGSDVAVVAGPPEPVAYDACPEIKIGTNKATFGGFARTFRVFAPKGEAAAAPGVMFIWHGLGDTSLNMANALGAQTLATKIGAYAVVPDSCCNSSTNQGCCNQLTGWGFIEGAPTADAELFDQLLSCMSQQFSIDRKRVYTTGFSAGALWSTWLVMHRSDYLAAAVLLSGGVNDFVQYLSPTRDVPIVATEGGPDDLFGGGVVNFHESTLALVEKLRGDGHFVALCSHNGGHTPPIGSDDIITETFSNHTWDTLASPFAAGLSAAFPSICKVVP